MRDELCALVGVEDLTKQALGDYIRRGPDCAARVNAIVHPRVAEAFERYCQQPAAEVPAVPSASAEISAVHHWMECAILFESGFDRLVDRVVVVTCPEAERIRRITARDNCDAATARRWLALQMTDEERLQRAAAHNAATHNAATIPPASAGVPTPFHIVNDGITPLEPQLDALLAALTP